MGGNTEWKAIGVGGFAVRCLSNYRPEYRVSTKSLSTANRDSRSCGEKQSDEGHRALGPRNSQSAESSAAEVTEGGRRLTHHIERSGAGRIAGVAVVISERNLST